MSTKEEQASSTPAHQYYEFEITLKDSRPRLWRRIQITSDATFLQLHKAIQDACDWGNYHLFQFCRSPYVDIIASGGGAGDNGDDDLDGFFAASTYDDGCDGPPAGQVKLSSFFSTQTGCTYLYDFGDDWEHTIKLKRTFTSPERFARRLVAGKGTFPPEDCGGLYGYYECVKVARGEIEDEDRQEWLESCGWSPDDFNLDSTRQFFDQDSW
jgi:hypothetical protein